MIWWRFETVDFDADFDWIESLRQLTIKTLTINERQNYGILLFKRMKERKKHLKIISMKKKNIDVDIYKTVENDANANYITQLRITIKAYFYNCDCLIR